MNQLRRIELAIEQRLINQQHWWQVVVVVMGVAFFLWRITAQPPPRSYLQQQVDAMVYVRDPRTGLCFGRSAGFTTIILVPCEAVLKLLPQPSQP